MKSPSLAPLRSKTQARIETCQRIIGYRFRNQRYIREALTLDRSLHRRLALAGDKAADLQLAACWYENKDRLALHHWVVMKTALLSNKNLAEVCLRLRIHSCTLTRCGTDRSMATTIEAILGAVWFDSSRNLAVVGSLMDRLGLTKHALLRSTHTAHQPQCKIHSSRSLPSRFFVGHHLGLLQLLFRHSHSFVLHQQAGRHSNLSRHEPARGAATERLLARMWSRLKHILPALNNVSETAQKWIAVPVVRTSEHRGQEPSPVDAANLPKQDGPALTHATDEQKSVNHDKSVPGITLPVQQPLVLSGRQGPTGWLANDTEWQRIHYFIWSVGKHSSQNLAKRMNLLNRLRDHREMLRKLPGRSLKSMPSDFPTDGVYLMTDSADESSDRSLSLQAVALERHRQLSQTRQRPKSHMRPEEERNLRLVERQLAKDWRARLELWLPPDAQEDAQEHQLPKSLPNSGQTSATSSETLGLGFPVTAAVDSTKISTAVPAEDKRPRRLGPVLWTTDAAQYQSVDWKQYLRKSTAPK